MELRARPASGSEAAHDALGDELVDEAIELAAHWLSEARAQERRHDRRVAERLAGIVQDPDGLAFTMRYVDRVARHRDDRAAAEQLAAVVHGYPTPAFLSLADRVLLRAGAWLAPRVPRLVVPLARRRLRRLVGHLVVDAEPGRLRRHIARLDGLAVNVNLLGEAVLGEEEATNRLEQTLLLVEDPAIDYVSVKVSSIASNLDLWSFDVTLERVKQRLRRLYERAAVSEPPTFVNLDMEEYHDLELTLRAFTEVLDEPQFAGLDAGIVIQAYLPDSFPALERLVAWAARRRQRGGAAIKVRLVKGANLAMERVHAATHRWHQAPYPSKADVDANYKRCVDWILAPDRAAAVRVGIGSHNLFDLAWAHLLVERRGLRDRVEFEMLQGIAPAQARVVRDATGSLRLYTPAVRRRDFDVAISYLVRRLEENTAPENFLRELFTLRPGSPGFDAQAATFAASVAARWSVGTQPRRATVPATPANGFDNEPDTDPSQPRVTAWIDDVRLVVPDAVAAPLVTRTERVDAVVSSARAAQHEWWAVAAHARRAMLDRVADELARRRPELLATMSHEGRKTLGEADPEVNEAIDFARWYAEGGLELEQVEHAAFTPLGVVAVVPPWNFPVAIPAGGVLAALAAGNGVVLKPAPETPRCAEVVAEACWAAGVPRELLQVLRVPDDHVGRHLVTTVDGVVLTGSWETAELFRSWDPAMTLFGETSGKNAMVITPQADQDLAVADLVRSAFGHGGQKCSAASIAILVGDVADDARFRRKLVDAVRSLRIGQPTEPGTTFGPLIGPARDQLAGALTRLDAGEHWLVEPRRVDDSGAFWTPGVKAGVAPGSPFHVTEYFGPVLGLMRAADLDEAIELQNAVPFGLTGGIHSLDDHEVETWLDRVEVGNAYVNRHITGAIVRRQPFGGWKRSVVGAGAKVGGFDQLLQFGTWLPVGPSRGEAFLAAARADDEHWWAAHYSVEHDPTGLFCEANVLRYRTRPGVVIRVGADAEADHVARCLSAARTARASCAVSVAPGAPHPPEGSASTAVVETDEAFLHRLEAHRWGRVRVVGSPPAALWRAASAAEVDVVDAPVTASGRLELRWYLREQSVSRTLHRFGNLVR